MKIVGFIASLLVSFLTFGQQSYYFSSPVPSEQTIVNTTEKNLFGEYSSDVATRVYEISADGIYIITTSISSISRELVRESSKYDVRNNMLYGLLDKDSVPCVLKGEVYYFGVKNKDILIDASSMNKLTQISATEYIINYYEDGLYVPAKMTFLGNTLTIEELDYENDTRIFNRVSSKETIPNDYFELIVLNPTEDEFTKLMKKGIFDSPQTFKRK